MVQQKTPIFNETWEYLDIIGYCKMYESRSKARMRLHAGQLEDVPAGTQRGCDIPKTSFARWGESIHFAHVQRHFFSLTPVS